MEKTETTLYACKTCGGFVESLKERDLPLFKGMNWPDNICECVIEHAHIVFDGPPGPEAGRFVEVETADGKGICLGEWIEREDGYWALVIPLNDPPRLHLQELQPLAKDKNPELNPKEEAPTPKRRLEERRKNVLTPNFVTGRQRRAGDWCRGRRASGSPNIDSKEESG